MHRKQLKPNKEKKCRRAQGIRAGSERNKCRKKSISLELRLIKLDKPYFICSNLKYFTYLALLSFDVANILSFQFIRLSFFIAFHRWIP